MNLFNRLRLKFQSVQAPVWVVSVAIVLFIGFFGASNWFRQVNLVTAQYDMGNMEQVVWHAVHGRGFTATSPVFATQEPRLAIHADFLLLAYAPFYALWPDPRVMLILQVLAVASGAIAVWRIAKRTLNPRWAAGFSVLYLCYPPLLWATTFDVHAIVLATPLLLWAWDMMERRRWLWFGVLLAAAALTKEEVGLVIGFWGLWMIWKKHTRRAGLIVAVAGIAWSVFLIGWAIPHARQVPGHFALDYFSSYGDTPGKVAAALAENPRLVVSDLWRHDGLGYLGMILGPLGLTSIASPVAAIALPAIAINIVSSADNLRAIFYHYTSAITPFLIVSSIAGVAWILRRWPQTRFRRGVIVWMIGWAAVYVWYWAPLPGMRFSRDAMQVFTASAYRQDIAIIKKQLSPNDKVAATNNIAAQFTGREWEWPFPLHLEQATAIVILRGGAHEIVSAGEIDTTVAQLKKDQRWMLVYQRNNILFFTRNR